IKNNYNNGTPVVKMDWDKYNESVKSATKVMQDTVIDNQWAMVENVVLFGTSGAIMKPFKEKDASTELLKNLSENTDYSMPYSSFNGSAVSSENKGDVKYIYYNGSLLSDKEYKQKIADQATKNYNTQNGK
ncbi:MAG: hypothetical protein IKL07_09605, partial [Clostridium sp.]|nr:hypothetical protein [Clostridium sp.]